MRLPTRSNRPASIAGAPSTPSARQFGDAIADQYGRAQIWKRITWVFYIVALPLMFAPDGNTLHYVGWMVSTVGLFPLVCWLARTIQVPQSRQRGN